MDSNEILIHCNIAGTMTPETARELEKELKALVARYGVRNPNLGIRTDTCGYGGLCDMFDTVAPIYDENNPDKFEKWFEDNRNRVREAFLAEYIDSELDAIGDETLDDMLQRAIRKTGGIFGK